MKKNLGEKFKELKIKQLDILERMKKIEKILEENPDEAKKVDEDFEDLAKEYKKIKSVKDKQQANKMID